MKKTAISTIEKIKSGEAPNHAIVIRTQIYEYWNNVYFKKVMETHPGDSFGELALLNLDCKRNATIKVKGDCTLAVLG